MKIVIDIPENVKNRFTSGVTCTVDMQIFAEALIDCIPLPDGHGRLVDADRLEQIQNDRLQNGEIRIWELKLITSALDAAETVVEADGGAE